MIRAVVYHVADSPHPPSIWESYLSWFPVFSNRPLAPIALALTSHLFGGCPRGFILVNLCFWFGATAPAHRGPATVPRSRVRLPAPFARSFSRRQLDGHFFSRDADARNHINFSFGALLPAPSPRRCPRSLLFAPYLLLLAALLTYEIILPLLPLTLLYPLALRPSNATDRPSRRFPAYLVKYVLPVVLILLAVLILQKWIMLHFMAVDSRLRLPRPRNRLLLLHSLVRKRSHFSAVAALECAVLSSGQLPRLPANGPRRHSSRHRLLCLAACEGLVFRLFQGAEVPTDRHDRSWLSVMSAALRLERFCGLYRQLWQPWSNVGLADISMLLACLPSLSAQRSLQILSWSRCYRPLHVRCVVHG